MDTLTGLRIIVAASSDLSLAWTCGGLLAAVWLGAKAKAELTSAALRGGSASLCIASWAQLVLLAATLSEHGSLAEIWAILPALLSTHMGRVPLALGGLSTVLMLWIWILRVGVARLVGSAVLLLGVLLLRSATGHAAIDGDFSRAEVLHWIHLSAMAVWSGGVLVSGLLIVPALRSRPVRELRTYLAALSRVSTWAVAMVIVSGMWKGYGAVGGDLHLWREGSWGRLLLVKIVGVGAVVALGARNRWLLSTKTIWDPNLAGKVFGTLRAEAWGMLLILALSATLANAPPPDH